MQFIENQNLIGTETHEIYDTIKTCSYHKALLLLLLLCYQNKCYSVRMEIVYTQIFDLFICSSVQL